MKAAQRGRQWVSLSGDVRGGEMGVGTENTVSREAGKQENTERRVKSKDLFFRGAWE